MFQCGGFVFIFIVWEMKRRNYSHGRSFALKKDEIRLLCDLITTHVVKEHDSRQWLTQDLLKRRFNHF